MRKLWGTQKTRKQIEKSPRSFRVFRLLPRFQRSSARLLFKLERKFECAAQAHWLAIFHRRLKLDLLRRFDGVLSQTMRQPSNDFNVSDLSVGAENDAQSDHALDIVVSRFLRVLSLLSV